MRCGLRRFARRRSMAPAACGHRRTDLDDVSSRLRVALSHTRSASAVLVRRDWDLLEGEGVAWLMEKALQGLLSAMGTTESALLPFFEAGGQDAIAEIREKHGPREAAEVQLALAYAVNALFFSYLKTQGVDPQTHPVKEELARVKGYMKKLKTAAQDKEAKANMLRLNKDAVSRFITAGIGTGGDSKAGGGGISSAAAGDKRKGDGKEKQRKKKKNKVSVK